MKAVKHMVRPLLQSFLLVVALVLLAGPSVSFACDCARVLSVEEELENSDAVFTGKVLKTWEGASTQKVLFEVDQIWKGASGSQVEMSFPQFNTSCAIHFYKSEKYLMYAKERKIHNGSPFLTAGMCGRTALVANAAEDLKVLGNGEPPKKEVNLEKRNFPCGSPVSVQPH
ncbi:hypothetical protein [Bacillus sp. FJAT-27245]|uniref:hypothetical protein n=1 Tax=Bacillus sp. FJAT-27245 TaxID=1684144 RepID=UPI000AA39EAB|nr:hypothetical protein [Bacillus sp. FJAT-27245]